MKKVLTWVLSFTKLGKVVDPAQEWLSGKKSYLAGLAIMVPALISMILGFSDHGLPYLLSINQTPEFVEFWNGVAIMGIRAAITKAADPKKDPNN